MSLEKFEYTPQNGLSFTGYQMRDLLYRRQESYFCQAEDVRNAIHDINALEQYRTRQKRLFLEHIGTIPFDGTPLDPKVISVLEKEAYRIETILFCSRKDTYVTGSMYIPHGLTAPSGAVLFVCGHCPGGRMANEYQMVCDTLARAGLIVFAIDPVGQGERKSYYDPASGEYKVPACTPDHDAAGIPSILTGRFMQAYFLCDEMRAVDYMLTRPEIDPARIGVTGHSGGGTQTLAMMAVDDRIAAAAPGTFVTSRRRYLYHNQAQDAEQIWYGMTEFGYDHIDPIMNFAPKPCAVLAVKYDFFPIEGTRETVEEAKRFYAMYGKEAELCLFEDDSHHDYTPWLARQAAAFFAKHLLNKEIDPEPVDFTPLPPEKMWATKSGNVRGEIPGARFVHDDVVEHAKALQEKRMRKSPDVRKREAAVWLRQQVDAYRENCEQNMMLCPERYVADGLECRPMMWRSHDYIYDLAQIIYPVGMEPETMPITLALWTDGTKRINAHSQWLQEECKKGRAVAVLDLFAMGNGEPLTYRGGPLKANYSTLYTGCTQLLFMKDSMAALRIHELLRTAELFGSSYGIKREKLKLYCEGDHGIYGIPAAFLDDTFELELGEGAVFSAMERYILPWYTDYNDDMSFMIPGMLEYFDYPELLEK